MIHILLTLCGLGWIVGHWLYVLCHFLAAPAALLVLYQKGYVNGCRDWAFALLLAAEGVTGLVLAALLHEVPRRGGVIPERDLYLEDVP